MSSRIQHDLRIEDDKLIIHSHIDDPAHRHEMGNMMFHRLEIEEIVNDPHVRDYVIAAMKFAERDLILKCGEAWCQSRAGQ